MTAGEARKTHGGESKGLKMTGTGRTDLDRHSFVPVHSVIGRPTSLETGKGEVKVLVSKPGLVDR